MPKEKTPALSYVFEPSSDREFVRSTDVPASRRVIDEILAQAESLGSSPVFIQDPVAQDSGMVVVRRGRSVPIRVVGTGHDEPKFVPEGVHQSPTVGKMEYVIQSGRFAEALQALLDGRPAMNGSEAIPGALEKTREELQRIKESNSRSSCHGLGNFPLTPLGIGPVTHIPNTDRSSGSIDFNLDENQSTWGRMVFIIALEKALKDKVMPMLIEADLASQKADDIIALQRKSHGDKLVYTRKEKNGTTVVISLELSTTYDQHQNEIKLYLSHKVESVKDAEGRRVESGL